MQQQELAEQWSVHEFVIKKSSNECRDTYRGLMTSECLPAPRMCYQPCDTTALESLTYFGDPNNGVVRHRGDDQGSGVKSRQDVFLQ
jgi:hypothetical protein